MACLQAPFHAGRRLAISKIAIRCGYRGGANSDMWISVAFVTSSAQAERLSDALFGQGALSVAIDDADAGTERETPQFGEPGSSTVPLWESSRVTALFDPAEDLAARLAAATLEAEISPPPRCDIGEVEERDWVALTQAQFDPIRVTERLWIVPSWHVAPDASAVNLVLDPGMAFGTGSHPTTWLCLEWLTRQALTGRSVLDYGCGSGVLGIAALRLGVAQALGVDIDDKALQAARANARRNGVPLQLRHSAQPLDTRFDFVIANILTNPLCVLAPLLVGRVAPGGRLALSGVLEAQAEQVIEAYAPFIGIEVEAVRDGWALLTGGRAC